MKHESDWADDIASDFVDTINSHTVLTAKHLLSAQLERAERRGFARAVGLLKTRSCSGFGVKDELDGHISWLEELE